MKMTKEEYIILKKSSRIGYLVSQNKVPKSNEAETVEINFT
jgi:hypothetical protein